MSPTFASLFSGGGLADIGAEAAGLTPLWAVEHDADIGGCYARNLPGRMLVADVRAVDPRDLPTPTILHASPPCQQHSQARSKRLAPREDGDIGLDVLRFVRALLPPAVSIENVTGYERADSFRAIVRGLWDLGYTVRWDTVDASDYQVPQTRRRLFLRAIRGGLLLPLPAPVRPKVGWYAALEDLLPTLPESRFAEWQLRRLGMLTGSTLVRGQNARSIEEPIGQRADEPSPTVTASDTVKGPPRAFLVHNQISQSQDAPIVRDGGEPGPIVTTNSGGRLRAFLVHTGNTQMAHPTGTGVLTPDEPANTVQATAPAPRAWLDGGRVVKLTPRCLARLQSVPDSYALPDSAALAGKVIGNGVPCLIAALVCRNLLHAVAATAA